MSYILDALRRAEAERGRGAVPDLHTLAAPAIGASAAGRPASVGLWIGALAVVAALAAGGTWWALQRQMPATARGAVAVVPPAVPVAVESAPSAPVPAAVSAPAPVAAIQAPAPRTADKPPAPLPRERHAAPPVVPIAGPAQELAAPPPSASPVFAQADLPDSVRAQLPALKVTGATHSNNPAHRMAIVNGQVLQEGEQAAPGLQLERIEPSRTVWSFRGYRYAVASQ